MHVHQGDSPEARGRGLDQVAVAEACLRERPCRQKAELYQCENTLLVAGGLHTSGQNSATEVFFCYTFLS